MKRLEKYEAVLWDLDGTLLDTLEDLKDGVNYVMRKYGLPERTLEEVRRAIGNGIHKLIERSVPAGTDGETVEAAYADFGPYYREHCTIKTKPYAGIAEILEKLNGDGTRLAVVTNKSNDAVQVMIPHYFGDIFDVVIGATERMPKKPVPDVVHYVLKEIGTDREKALFIGDSQVDVETAKNAGLDSILVTWGFRNREELMTAGAANMVDDAEGLSRKMQEMDEADTKYTVT